MKAFLSHSSKDKAFVRKVAELIGTARCEYDEYTFDFILNAQAIRQALRRCDLFVFFLSKDSIRSDFVAEELRTALDFRASGQIKRVMVFCLDDTSFKALPEWMQAINVVRKLLSVPTCVRKIEAELMELEASSNSSAEIYIPRSKEDAELRQALRKPPGVAPVVVHAVGHLGVGRRTFLKKSLTAVYPRQIRTYAPILLDRFEGVNEFYRRLYDTFGVSNSWQEKTELFEKFLQADRAAQAEIIFNILIEIAGSDEVVLIEDHGGLYDDAGNYQQFILDVIKLIKGSSRPLIAVCQTRMMPLKLRVEFPESYHTYIGGLSGSDIVDLVSFSLRDQNIDFSDQQLSDVCELLDGQPLNVKLALSAIKTYGLSSFLADPSLLVEWKRNRAEDFLEKIAFSTIEIDILKYLFEYRFTSYELLLREVRNDAPKISAALRRLEEFCCLERKGDLFLISPPIHNAVGHDKRFRRTRAWRQKLALDILSLVESYKADESVPVALLESGVTASIISGKQNALLSALVLPSYYVSLAHEAYNEDRRREALDLSKKAYEYKARLSTDGCIEALRLWGLSAIRLNEENELDKVLSELRKYNDIRSARQHHHFLKGFKLRIKKKFDEAEAEFLGAYKLGKRNISINRELANLYRHQKEFDSAEMHARIAHKERPTNPFVIDVLLEALLGKAAFGLMVDQQEISNLFADLKRYGDVPGSSFYQARVAQDNLRKGDKPGALKAANAAIVRTPEHLPSYNLRADIFLSMGDVVSARQDFEKMNQILDRRGGLSESDEGRTAEIEVRILTEEQRFREAREKLQNSLYIPSRTRKRLENALVRRVRFDNKGVDARTIDWANKFDLADEAVPAKRKVSEPKTRGRRPSSRRQTGVTPPK